MKKYVVLLVAIAIFIAGCGRDPAYEVAGTIVDSKGQGVGGVTVMVGGTVATTNAQGQWQVAGIRGPATIVPTKDDVRFDPASYTVRERTKDVIFTLLPSNFSVAGRITDVQGAGMWGITVVAQGTGLQTTTGLDGRWRLDDVTGKVTIVPQRDGVEFRPNQFEVSGEETEIAIQALHPIMGPAAVTREQAKTWLRGELQRRGRSMDYLELVDYYYDIAPIYGLRPEVALAQAAHETGYFGYGNLVLPWQNNFAGIGATGAASDGFTPLNGADPERVRFEAGIHGAIWSTPEAGVEGHIQHLYAYASNKPLPAGRKLLSPRFVYVPRGSAPYVEYLGRNQNPSGIGWATDAQYGFKIIHNFITPMQRVANL